MVSKFIVELRIAEGHVADVKTMLGELLEQELEALTGYKPIISVMIDTLDFLMNNMVVIRKRLE